MQHTGHKAILALLLLASPACCPDAGAETLVEIGPSQVAEDWTTGGVMLTLSQRVYDRFDLTLGYISDQDVEFCDRADCAWTLEPQWFAGVDWVIKSPWTDKLRFGIGPYYFQNRDRVGTTNFRLGLNLEYRFNRRWGFRSRYFSTAGLGSEHEYCRPEWGCVSGDWNTGQDSWARVIWYF